MATENIDFTAILAVLEAKRAALDALIGSYRAALSLGALGQPGEVDMTAITTTTGAKPALGGPPIELPTGAFLGKSIGAAIKLYLGAIRRKQTTKEITAALKEGGVESTSDNFESVVLASLGSLRRVGDVLRFKDGWALAELYPAHLRQGLAAGKDKGKPATARKRSAKPNRPERKPQAVAKKSAASKTKAGKPSPPASAEPAERGAA